MEESLIQGAPEVFGNDAAKAEREQEALTAHLYQQIGNSRWSGIFVAQVPGYESSPASGYGRPRTPRAFGSEAVSSVAAQPFRGVLPADTD